jgi:hypothetical protein
LGLISEYSFDELEMEYQENDELEMEYQEKFDEENE